jgi:hypothetical protein
MFRVFLEVAFVTIVIAWVLAKALSALGRWFDKRRNSGLARDIELDAANHPDERVFGAPDLVVAIVLLFLLLMPNAVTSNRFRCMKFPIPCEHQMVRVRSPLLSADGEPKSR